MAMHYLLTDLLREDELRVVRCILSHIEKDGRRASIQTVAGECYVSAAYIIKLCKKLGYEGYSELCFALGGQLGERLSQQSDSLLQQSVSSFDAHCADAFLQLLRENAARNLFVIGAGFGDITADYIASRLAVFGFHAYHRALFYDYVTSGEGDEAQKPSFIIAISQGGETRHVLDNVQRAKVRGYKVVAFTRAAGSTLAKQADITFLVDPDDGQLLLGHMPNTFFGKVILAFEALLGRYVAQSAEADATFTQM
ncbi:MAG: MurR/RpiR family transcriptional regulator [Oscillospiraceae bacterium]|nr:MurR/RpiR family transcriptional regulator [Oscillospiraceae bacterium]